MVAGGVDAVGAQPSTAGSSDGHAGAAARLAIGRQGRGEQNGPLAAVGGPYGGVGGACRCADGRERLAPFSLDNVTADLWFIGGSPRCRHAPQNLQNPQNRPAGEVL